jgi:hypothetical protein
VLSAVNQHLSLTGIMIVFVNIFNELIIYHSENTYRKTADSIIEYTNFLSINFLVARKNDRP